VEESLAPSVAPGQRLGKYVVTEKLGEGGMGMVFAGVHEALGREVAIKLLRAEYAQNKQLVPRFQAEAEAVSRIGHTNIVAVYDFGKLPDGSLYYVMERIRGQTLAERLYHPGAPPLTRDETVGIFAQICRALQATHARHIVHRDLKPENVILQTTRPGQPPVVKVLDFGIAKMRGDDQRNLTGVGMMMGTPMFMAPEQATHCHLVDARADLYSLGAMLYQVLTGAPPFVGEPMVVLTKHLNEMPEPPSKKSVFPPGKKFPRELDAMVLRSLAKDPAQRQPDAATFLAELEAAWPSDRPASMKFQVQRPSASGPIIVNPPPPRKRSPAIVALLAGVLLAGGAAAFVLTRPPAPAPVVSAPPKAESPAQKALADLLGGDVAARRSAIEAVGETADRAALPLVRKALADANPEVRRAAAIAAALVGDASLLPELAQVGEESGGALALELAVSRYRLGEAAAQAELERALAAKAGDGPARLRAAMALAERGKLKAARLRAAIAAAPNARRALKWAAYTQLSQLDPSFHRELERAFAGQDPDERLDAAQTLAHGGDARAKRFLVGISHAAKSAGERIDAAVILAELGDANGVVQVTAALGAEEADVRARAACALGRLRKAPAPRLTPLIQDGDPAVRACAAAALEAAS
jgi:serine/threonine-protein kinase